LRFSPRSPACKIPCDREAVQLASIVIDHADDPKAEAEDTSGYGEHPADYRDPPQDPENQKLSPKYIISYSICI